MSELEQLVSENLENEEIEVPKKRGRGRPRKKEEKPGALTDAAEPVVEEVFSKEEIQRRRDILITASVLGQLEDYVKENVTPAKIRIKPEDRLNSLFAVYQAKLGQELTLDTMDGIVCAAIKGLSYLVDFDDNEALKQDLLKNKGLQQILGKQAAGVSEKYGDFVAFGRIFLDVFKHVKFPGQPVGEASVSEVKEDAGEEN